MNQIIARVSKIQTVQNLNIVSFEVKKQTLKMMSLDLSDNIQVGTKVTLAFKPTTVAIAKNFTGELSYSNQLKVFIKSLDIGELLCVLTLEFGELTFESIITTDSQKRMNLQHKDEVIALIKSSDLSIKRVL